MREGFVRNEFYYSLGYLAIILEIKDPIEEDITSRHNDIASTKGLDKYHFVILDSAYEQERALVIQVNNPKDQIRCKGAPAGELIWCIARGLATCGDVKNLKKVNRSPFTQIS